MAANALIVNFAGLGDGFIEVPFLRNMQGADPQARFFHTGGLLFDDAELMRALKLHSCAGVVSAIWRRFAPEHWGDIEAFVEEQAVTRIVNLRNLGPQFDPSYFDFKRRMHDRLEFVNFPFDGAGADTRNIREDIDDLLRCAGLLEGRVDRGVLRNLVLGTRSCSVRESIGINIHAGSPFKRWPFDKWKTLCLGLIDIEPLKIFYGHGEDECAFALQLRDELAAEQPDRVRLVGGRGILDMLREIATMRCVVSVDSWAPHAAGALSTPCVALHIVTSGRTWGAESGLARVKESPYLRKCSRFSAPLGVCLDQYSGCQMVRKFGDGIAVKEVLALVLNTIEY